MPIDFRGGAGATRAGCADALTGAGRLFPMSFDIASLFDQARCGVARALIVVKKSTHIERPIWHDLARLSAAVVRAALSK